MRRRKISISASPTPEVNVTPLIDVVLVLLIIFMVISPLVNERLSARLAETATAMDAQPDPTQIVVRIDKTGAMRINDDTITSDAYVDALREKLQNRRSAERLVLFDADDAGGYGRLVHALDGAKQAGATTLGFVMPDAHSEN